MHDGSSTHLAEPTISTLIMLMSMGDWMLLWLGGVSLFFLTLFPPTLHYLRAKGAAKGFNSPLNSNHRPNITIILPMRNESTNVKRKIEEVSSMTYPSERVTYIILDSGSTDGTATIAERHVNTLDTNSHWMVRRIEIPGKSIAVNAAIDLVKTEYFVMMDADSICSTDSLGRLMDWFVNPEIGAVCAQYKSQSKDLDPYRSRFNTLRIGESALISTPIFEGSLCAFRKSAIAADRVDPAVNADDSQLAMIVSRNGFRAIMDPTLSFSEETEKVSRKRSVRRAQGLSRALFSSWRLCFSPRPFGSIMVQSIYFHLVMPWMIAIAIVFLVASSIVGFFQEGASVIVDHIFISTAVPILLALLSNIGRAFLSGISVLIESQSRFFLGQKLQVWDTIRVGE